MGQAVSETTPNQNQGVTEAVFSIPALECVSGGASALWHAQKLLPLRKRYGVRYANRRGAALLNGSAVRLLERAQKKSAWLQHALSRSVLDCQVCGGHAL